MNRKQLLFAAVLMALIGWAALIVFNRGRQSWAIKEARVGDKLLPSFQLNAVAAIHIKGKEDFNVIYTNGIWRVRERGHHAANLAQIRNLLMRLGEVRVVESDLIGPSQLERLGLKSAGTGNGSGTLFEFTDATGKVLASLLTGKKHDRPHNSSEPRGLRGLFDGRYVLLPNDPGRALLVSDELINAAPEPGMWLNPEFFKVEDIKFLSVASTNAAESWEISRENASSPWLLANSRPGEILDMGVANDAAEILAFPTFVDVVVPHEQREEKPTALRPAKVVTAVTDTLCYTLRIGPKHPDGNYLMTVSVATDLRGETPGVGQESSRRTQGSATDKLTKERALSSWIYVVDSWIELVIRDRSQILQKATLAGDAPGRS